MNNDPSENSPVASRANLPDLWIHLAEVGPTTGVASARADEMSAIEAPFSRLRFPVRKTLK
jgi:hypothetical protein